MPVPAPETKPTPPPPIPDEKPKPKLDYPESSAGWFRQRRDIFRDAKVKAEDVGFAYPMGSGVMLRFFHDGKEQGAAFFAWHSAPMINMPRDRGTPFRVKFTGTVRRFKDDDLHRATSHLLLFFDCDMASAEPADVLPLDATDDGWVRTVTPHFSSPVPTPKPADTERPPPTVTAKKPTDPPPPEEIGILSARDQAVKLRGKRIRLNVPVSSWEEYGDGLRLTIIIAGDKVCVMELSADERKKLPDPLPADKWKVMVEATIDGRKEGLLQLSGVKVIKEK